MKYNLKTILRGSTNKIISKGNYIRNRSKAKYLRRSIIKIKGSTVVNSRLFRRIKDYSKKAFGDSSYWPWLALYAEIRNEYIEGWIPYDYYRFEVLPKYNPKNEAALSALKTFDSKLFESFSVHCIAYKINGLYFNSNKELISEDDLLNQVKNHEGEVVIKSDYGKSGIGIKFIRSDNIDKKDLNISKSLVIQPLLRQHRNIDAITSSSVNTIRILTFMNETGEIESKYQLFRFGLKNSRTDNIDSGGGLIFINTEGEPISAAYNGQGIVIGEKHPESNFFFKDLKVPSVQDAVDKCKYAHLNYPYVRIIGWDILIDETKSPKLIEWNARGPTLVWLSEAIIGPNWNESKLW